MPKKANVLQGKAKSTHPYPTVQLDPDSQHVPLNPDQSHLRPPPPNLDPNKSENDAKILVYAVSHRDGRRCGYTILTALQRARYPDRVRVAVVDQAVDDEGDIRCVRAYCDLARQQRPAAAADADYSDAAADSNSTTSSLDDCPRRDQLIVDERDAKTFSRGPLVARHYLQRLVGDDHDFCLGIDGHSIFTNDWDLFLLKDWKDTENEMAVITTYIHHVHSGRVKPNGDNNPFADTPHICDVKVGGHGLPRNEGTANIHNVTRPILMSKWGAGFAFSKCHSERRVPIDVHGDWIFDGEEFSRAALLFMAGYDMYSPSLNGHAVYHNYTGNPVTLTWGKRPSKEEEKKKREEVEMGANRLKLHIGQPFEGKVNTNDFRRFDILGGDIPAARSLEQFLNFTGVDYRGTRGSNWTHRCHQLHWVPYEHPEVVEAIVPGWRQGEVKEGSVKRDDEDVADAGTSKPPIEVAGANEQPTDCMYHGNCDELAMLTGGMCTGGTLTGVLMATNLVLMLLFFVTRRKK